ncbi:hypothetical protein BC567DRAFT_68105 [Phyllosticta citribraziliensis]
MRVRREKQSQTQKQRKIQSVLQSSSLSRLAGHDESRRGNERATRCERRHSVLLARWGASRLVTQRTPLLLCMLLRLQRLHSGTLPPLLLPSSCCSSLLPVQLSPVLLLRQTDQPHVCLPRVVRQIYERSNGPSSSWSKGAAAAASQPVQASSCEQCRRA